jgi:hypothetical protein
MPMHRVMKSAGYAPNTVLAVRIFPCAVTYVFPQICVHGLSLPSFSTIVTKSRNNATIRGYDARFYYSREI